MISCKVSPTSSGWADIDRRDVQVAIRTGDRSSAAQSRWFIQLLVPVIKEHETFRAVGPDMGEHVADIGLGDAHCRVHIARRYVSRKSRGETTRTPCRPRSG